MDFQTATQILGLISSILFMVGFLVSCVHYFYKQNCQYRLIVELKAERELAIRCRCHEPANVKIEYHFSPEFNPDEFEQQQINGYPVWIHKSLLPFVTVDTNSFQHYGLEHTPPEFINEAQPNMFLPPEPESLAKNGYLLEYNDE